jgi:hypothetical protein
VSKNTHPASRALKELKEWRELNNGPARKLAAKRWPERAVAASVQARVRRCWWAVLSGLMNAGTLSW